MDGLTEKELKLQLRLALLEKNEACKDDFLIFVKNVFIAVNIHWELLLMKMEFAPDVKFMKKKIQSIGIVNGKN